MRPTISISNCLNKEGKILSLRPSFFFRNRLVDEEKNTKKRFCIAAFPIDPEMLWKLSQNSQASIAQKKKEEYLRRATKKGRR